MSLPTALESRSPDAESRAAQIGHARMPIAQPQFVDLRHDRPAAARDDPVIGLHGVRRGFRGRCRKRRRGRPRHVNGARGLIEALAELAVIGLADQRIERLVFGQRPADSRAAVAAPASPPRNMRRERLRRENLRCDPLIELFLERCVRQSVPAACAPGPRRRPRSRPNGRTSMAADRTKSPQPAAAHSFSAWPAGRFCDGVSPCRA